MTCENNGKAENDCVEENNRFFEPWVGNCYRGGGVFSKRVMIVGASHYAECVDECPYGGCGSCDDTACTGFTRQIVNEYLDGDGDGNWTKTFSSFINSVYGHSADEAEKRDFFDSVVFFNYLQEIEGRDGSDSHPAKFNDARHLDNLREMIDEYEPDVVVFWGNHVYEAIPLDLGDGDAERDDEYDAVYRYSYNGRAFTAIFTRHPSQGFNKTYWNAVLEHCDATPCVGRK